MTIKQFIKNNKFYYVNPSITDENFPPQKVEKGEAVIYNVEKTMFKRNFRRLKIKKSSSR